MQNSSCDRQHQIIRDPGFSSANEAALTLLSALVLFLFLTIIPLSAHAQYIFKLIADQQNQAISPLLPSFIAESEIAFSGTKPGNIFKVGPTAVPFTLLEPGGTIPGTDGGVFSKISLWSFDGESFAFSGSDASGQQGIYAMLPEGFVALAGPGSNRVWQDGNVAVDGDNVAFLSGVTTDLYPAAIHARRGGVEKN